MKVVNIDTLIEAIKALPDCPNGYSDTYDKNYILSIIDDLPTKECIELKAGTTIDNEFIACNEKEAINVVKSKLVSELAEQLLPLTHYIEYEDPVFNQRIIIVAAKVIKDEKSIIKSIINTCSKPKDKMGVGFDARS